MRLFPLEAALARPGGASSNWRVRGREAFPSTSFLVRFMVVASCWL